MKDEILKLRKDGKSYKEISILLNCAKSTVIYHCGGDDQKNKSKLRTEKYRKNHCVINKVENFQRSRFNVNGKRKLGERNIQFTWRDVIEKFGWKTQCYLTGREIDLHETTTYNFDHIIPFSKSNDSSINNLGITCVEANKGKSDLLISEFVNLCKEVLEHNGYTVELRNRKPMGDGTSLETKRG